MALSGTNTFVLNRDNLIKSALRLTTAYESGESVSPDEIADASEVLNMILKDWSKDGLHLWMINELTVTLIASTNSYTIGPSGGTVGDRPLRLIDDCFLRATAADTPIEVLSRQEYNDLGNKSTEGVPHSIYYDPTLTNGTLYVYVTPNTAAAAANVLHIKYEKLIDDVSAAADDVEIPQEWFRALRFALAADLAVELGLADLKPATMNRLSGMAQKLKKEIMDWDVENTSTWFEAERRG